MANESTRTPTQSPPWTGASGAVGTWLSGGRVRFQQGSLDLVIWAQGPQFGVRAGYARAWRRFEALLQELQEEKHFLLRPHDPVGELKSPVIRRMRAACRPYQGAGLPTNPVHGAVADDVVAALTCEGGVERAYVNCGRDTAFHLSAGQALSFDAIGAGPGPEIDSACAAIDRAFVLDAVMPSRGLSCRGRRTLPAPGRTAVSVAVLAANAAVAAIAATAIVNVVDGNGDEGWESPTLDPDVGTVSGPRWPTSGPDPSADRIETLRRGEQVARELEARGLLDAVAIEVQGVRRTVGM